ncbi:MAG: diacylglycerol kinase family lipid kinase [Phycisphaerae bacterium]|nr:diacylglycerol kinase family lipid kinase [Phycisphaerae bacterium]
MIENILAIINPISGYARARQLPMKLQRRLRDEGFSTRIHITQGPNDATDYVHRHGGDFDLVIACGGDGTVRDVVSAASVENIPVTVFPTGTENLFSKELGITSDLDCMVRMLRHGHFIDIDMATVNDKRFLLLSGIGFDARVLLMLNRFRTGNITHLTYFWPIWRTFWEYDFPPINVQADGQLVMDNEPGLVFISNIRRYAVGLQICKRAEKDDARMDLCIYKTDHQISLLAHAWRTVLGRHVDHPNVVYRQASDIKIWSDREIPFAVDGDPAGFLPATYQVLPKALKVLVPPE